MSNPKSSQMPKEQHLQNCIAIAIFKLVEEMSSGAYVTYVSILNSSQIPKEHCYAIFYASG